MCRNKKAMGLVSMMSPIELMKGLVKDLDILPKDAARMVMDLKKYSEALSNPSIETNKEYPVPAAMRNQPEDNQEENAALGRPQGKSSFHGPTGFPRHHFPPDPREKPGDFPYDDVFTNYMNSPKRKKPLMTGREPKVKTKQNPLNPNFGAGQPGGDGAGGGGMHRRSSGNGSMPGSGASFSVHGPSGWSSAPPGAEFDVPPKTIKRARRKSELTTNRPPNAGDNDGTPSFMKTPNVGQTIWDPKTGKSGTSNHRMKPWRGYGKR